MNALSAERLIVAINRLTYVNALASLCQYDPECAAYRRDLQNMVWTLTSEIGDCYGE